MEIDPAGNPAAAKEQEAKGSASDDEFSDLTIVIAPLTMPAKLLREPPWTPMVEPHDLNLRHMAVGVAWALRSLMINHATPGWIPPVLNEQR